MSKQEIFEALIALKTKKTIFIYTLNSLSRLFKSNKKNQE